MKKIVCSLMLLLLIVLLIACGAEDVPGDTSAVTSTAAKETTQEAMTNVVTTVLPETNVAITTAETTLPITTATAMTAAPETTVPITYTAENFMIAIPDKTPLSKIALPGTHDSGATKDHSLMSGTAKCQTLSIAEQLSVGVRYLDIRLKRENGILKVYHGTVDQKLTFDKVLTDIYAFLEKNPSETLIVCIKEETDAEGENAPFDVTVKSYIDADKEAWFTQNRIPTLGEVRGKIVLWRRYGTSGTFGFNAADGFADNTTFTLTSGSYKLAVQDHYNCESPEKKWEAITAFMKSMKTPAANTYFLNNTSGYKPGLFSIPSIPTISDYVNPKLLEFLKSAEGTAGIIATDFMTAALAEAIWQLNFTE